MWGLLGMTLAREKYPWNFVALAVFTCTTATFFALLHTNFRSYANFQVRDKASCRSFTELLAALTLALGALATPNLPLATPPNLRCS